MALPESLQEFDQLVTKHIELHRKLHGKTLTRTEGTADFRLHYPSVSAWEKDARGSTLLRESAVDSWLAMGFSPEAAKTAAGVVESESKAVADFNYDDWRAIFGRR